MAEPIFSIPIRTMSPSTFIFPWLAFLMALAGVIQGKLPFPSALMILAFFAVFALLFSGIFAVPYFRRKKSDKLVVTADGMLIANFGKIELPIDLKTTHSIQVKRMRNTTRIFSQDLETGASTLRIAFYSRLTQDQKSALGNALAQFGTKLLNR